MALDKAKTQKAAEKFIASGKIPQAIEEYLKILKENPKDWNLMIQLGDLYLKINKNPDAIGMFTKVADHYYSDGFFLKAIAIYKRINKLDPALIDICIKLADLYLKQGLTMDAKSQLQAVAQHYVSKNQTKEAIQTFRKLIEIEPDNLKTRNELAKAYKNENMIPEAIKEYLDISDELTRKNLLKESLAVLETAYKLDARNISILRKILSIYNEQNEIAKGTSLLEDSLRTDPSNAEVLALLAESYAGRKQYAKAYETIDRALLNTSNKEPLWSLKGDLYLKEGDLDRAFGQHSLVVERHVQRREADKAIALMQRLQRVDPSFPPVLQKLVDLYTMAHQETNMLTAYNALIDAYISKAMYTDASKYLEKLIQIEPDNAQHHEKLGFVKSFLEKPKAPEPKEPAREEVSVESDISEGEISSGDFDLGISLETEPGIPFFETQTPPAPVAVPQAKPAMATAPALVEVSEDEKDFVSEHLIEAEVFTKYGLIDKAIEQLQIIVAKYPNSALAHQKLKEIYLEKGERDKAVEECVSMSRIFRKQGDSDQAEDMLSEARQINPNHPILDEADKEKVAPATSAGADVLGEIEKLAQSMKMRPSGKTAAKPAPKASPPPVVPEVQEEIEIEIEEPVEAPAGEAAEENRFEEIDFYIGQGLTSEAKKLLHAMRQKTPNDTGVLSRLAKLGEKIPEKAAPPAPPPPVEIEVPVDQEISFSMDEQPSAPSFDFNVEQEEEEAAAGTEGISFEFEPKSATGKAEETWDFGKLAQKKAEAESFDLSLDIPEQEQEPVEQVEQEPVEQEPEAEVPDLGLNIEEPTQLEEELALEIPAFEEEEETPEPIQVEPAEEELAPVEVEEPAQPEPAMELELPEVQEEEPIVEQVPEELQVMPEEPQVLFEEPPVVPEELPEEEEATPILEIPAEEVLPELQLETPAELPEAQEPEVEPEKLDMAEEEPASFGDIGADLADFGELDTAQAAPEEKEDTSLSDALDAAFEGAKEEAIEESKPVQASQELFQEEEDFFDLAAELEEGFLNVQSAVEEERPADGQNYSLEEILTDFKKGVEKQLGSEDYDTRYNLGIAYKEMGLIDEAIAEFQIASKDSKRFLECCSMLGLCFVEKGMSKLAIKWYQRGLDTPGHTEDEYQGLRFELAQAHEASGEPDKALETYQEVYGINANYRNVSKKMKELQDLLKKK